MFFTANSVPASKNEAGSVYYADITLPGRLNLNTNNIFAEITNLFSCNVGAGKYSRSVDNI